MIVGVVLNNMVPMASFCNILLLCTLIVTCDVIGFILSKVTHHINIIQYSGKSKLIIHPLGNMKKVTTNLFSNHLP